MPPRFFKHGELPLVLLALIDEQPRHGYDLMAELTRLFGPRYRASPGSIYPAIEALQVEGLITGHPTQDHKVVYQLTSPGQLALQDRADQLAALEVRAGVRLDPGAESLDALLRRFRARLVPLTGLVDPQAAVAILDQAAVAIEALHPTQVPRQRTHV